MIRGYNASSIDIKHSKLKGNDSVTTGVAAVDIEGDMEVGVWEHSVGRSIDTEVEEVFVVITGRGTVTCDRGGEIILEPGTIGLLPSGAKTVWTVTEPLRKVWITLT
jgi:uncharacterized cupin superfamily protein